MENFVIILPKYFESKNVFLLFNKGGNRRIIFVKARECKSIIIKTERINIRTA